MYEVSLISNISDFLDYTQLISLLQDQMNYIGSPKTNEELISTIKMAFETDHAKLMVLSDNSRVIGFTFFNIGIGMESAGKYLWLNEMHIHRSFRSQGYGKILLDELKKWCVQNDVKRIVGMADDTEVRTLEFYRKNEFEVYPQQILSKKI